MSLSGLVTIWTHPHSCSPLIPKRERCNGNGTPRRNKRAIQGWRPGPILMLHVTAEVTCGSLDRTTRRPTITLWGQVIPLPPILLRHEDQEIISTLARLLRSTWTPA